MSPSTIWKTILEQEREKLFEELTRELHNAAVEVYPEHGITEAHTAKYLGVMITFLSKGLAKFRESVTGELQIEWNNMNRMAGRIKVNGKLEYVSLLFLNASRISLVHRAFKGNAGKNSRVTLNPLYRDKLMAIIMYTPKELEDYLNPKFQCDIEENSNLTIPVNLYTLDSFIHKTAETFERAMRNPSSSTNYKRTLQDNHITANSLKANVKLEDGRHVVKEHWQEIDSGRLYAKGISLQTVPSQVRHAALGHCHQYDLQAASFALMAGLALKYDPELKIAAIRDYVSNRSNIRKMIATRLGVTEDLIKQVFTSLGFGAKMVASSYKAIHRLLRDERFHALKAMKEYQHISEDMDLVRDTILANFDEKAEFYGFTYSPLHPETGKKRTADQKLAWIYQVLETQAINMFGAAMEQQGYVILLWVHDCLYFSERLPLSKFEDAQITLRKEFPLLRIEHTAIWPIGLDSDYEALKNAEDAMEAEHRQAIAEEEERSGAPMKDPVGFDPLDIDHGEYAEVIKALNPDLKRGLGTTLKLKFPGADA